MSKNIPSTILLLASFNEKQLKKFRKLVSCGYFHNDSSLPKLLAILEKKILKKDTKELFDDIQRAKVYQQLTVDSVINNHLSKEQNSILLDKLRKLEDLGNKFLLIEGIEESYICQVKLLSKKLLENKQPELLRKFIIKKEKAIEKNEDCHELSWELARANTMYLFKQEVLTRNDNIAEAGKHLDIWYIINKLEIHLTQQSIINISGEISKMQELSPINALKGLIYSQKYEYEPIIKLYLVALKLLKDFKEESFKELKELLLEEYEDKEFIPKRHLINFYNAASNFCTKQVRSGLTDYREELFSLYEKMVNKKLLLEKDVVQIVHLQNIIVSSCKVGRIDWAKDTIEEYRKFIKKEIRESAYYCMLSIIAFYDKNYKIAETHLADARQNLPKKPLINLNTTIRILGLKIMYKNDIHYLYARTRFNTEKKFFKSQKDISKQRRKGCLNFITILEDLYKLRHKQGKVTLSKIITKIESMEYNYDKEWLLTHIKNFT